MNDEYLWQKTGTDPEIEKMEDTLAVFRYRDAPLPTAAAHKVASAERASRWQISLAFAFASCVAVAILAVAWFQVSREESSSGNAPEVVFVAGPEIPGASLPVVTEPTPAKPQPIEPPTRRSRSGPVKIHPMIASVRRRLNTKDQTPQDSVAALTPEERYAYRQLMLALSITGSKLKIVQNVIDGTEDTDSNDKR